MISLKCNSFNWVTSILKLLLAILSCTILFSCSDNDDGAPEEKEVVATCSDGIMNQDEVEIDCGGVCEKCEVESFVLSVGTYQLIWNSTTDTNKTFSNDTDNSFSELVLEVADNGELNGSFLWKQSENSPKFDIGPITITITADNKASLKFIETPPTCRGEFNGQGELKKDNQILFDITGTDCDGNHRGTIELILKK